MSASAAPAIHLQQATVRAGDRTLLDALDLTIEPGEQVAVLGPSGAGKSTLLRLCAALLWPTSGTATVLGRRTDRLRGRALRHLRRDVGLLHQSDNLVPGLRVAHNVLMGRLGHWSLLRALGSLLFPRELDAAHAALQRVELGDALWALPGTLSGGEQQRVAVARLLLQSPRLWLCDEPVASLDPRLGREIVRLLSAEARGRGGTLVVSLHTLERLHDGFDRVLALSGGRLVWQGRPDQVTQAVLQRVYGAEYRTLHLADEPAP